MEKKSLVKPWKIEKLKEFEMVDERGIVLSTYASTKQTAKKVVGSAVKAAFTSLLFGYYSVPSPVPVEIALHCGVLHIIPNLGKRSTKQKLFEKTVTVEKNNVEKMFYKRKYFCLVVNPDTEMYLLAKKKFSAAFEEIIDDLGREKFQNNSF